MATRRPSRQTSSKRREARVETPLSPPPVVGPARAGRYVRLGILAGAVLLVAIGVVVGVRFFGRAGRGELPAPPTAGLNSAVSAHLRERYAAASQAPGDIAAVGPLCIAYHADMFFDLADRCYVTAGDLDSANWRWPYFRTIIRTERGGGDALVAMVRDIVEAAPQFGPAWLRLGDAEFKASNYDAAADAWRHAIDLPEPAPEGGDSPPHVVEFPMRAYATLGLARVALVKNDVDRAREMLEQLTMMTPNFGPGFRLLGDAYRALGRTADADRAVYRAGRLLAYSPYADPMMDVLARESRNSTLLLRLASEATLSVNASWSEYLTRRAAQFDPDNPEVVLKLARVLRTVDRNEEALTLFQKYRQMVPGDVQVLAHIGSCLSAMGRYAEAETYFRDALARLDDPITHYNMGLLLAVTGRLDGAIAEYERALQRDPSQVDARGNLAIALVRQGQLDRATRELTTLIEQDPDNASAHTNLGLVLLQQGRREQARAHLQEAMRIDPTLAQAAEALRSLGP